MFTGYVREECNEDTLTFLNDTIDRIEVGDDVTVKLKKNIKVDRVRAVGYGPHKPIADNNTKKQ